MPLVDEPQQLVLPLQRGVHHPVDLHLGLVGERVGLRVRAHRLALLRHPPFSKRCLSAEVNFAAVIPSTTLWSNETEMPSCGRMAI